MRICAGNCLKCGYVREMAKSAILHPPHLNVASVLCDYKFTICNLIKFDFSGFN